MPTERYTRYIIGYLPDDAFLRFFDMKLDEEVGHDVAEKEGI